MGIRDWPTIAGTPSQEAAHRKAVRRGAQKEGDAARRAGLAIRKCPPFVDPDMTVDWRIGWRYEDQCTTGKRDRKTGALRD